MKKFLFALAWLATAGLWATPQVFIDPGHGGSDLGVHDASLNEASLVFGIAQELQELLSADGIESELSRDAGSSPSLATRSAEANASGARAFVSLHINFSPSPLVHGPRIFIAKAGNLNRDAAPLLRWNDAANAELDASKSLGEALARSLESVDQSKVGVQSLKLAAFKGLAIPGVLVELGFLSNEESHAHLADAGYRHRLAQDLETGLRNWLASEASAHASGSTP